MSNSKRVIFVSGQEVVYDLSQQEIDNLLESIERLGYHEVVEGTGVYWVSDLEKLQHKARFVTK